MSRPRRVVETVGQRQRWSEDIRQQARALHVADGAKLAAEVTGVPERTVREWARTGNWRQQDPATDQASDQQDSPDAPDGPLPEPAANSVGLPPTGDPARDLARDLALARRVFRLQAEKFLEGQASASAYQAASVSLGIMEDKANKLGLPGSRGGEWSWAQNRAEAQGNLPLLRQWLAGIRERLAIEREQGGG